MRVHDIRLAAPLLRDGAIPPVGSLIRGRPRRSECQRAAQPADEPQCACGDPVADDRTQTSTGSLRELVALVFAGGFAHPGSVIAEIRWHFGKEGRWEHGLASKVRPLRTPPGMVGSLTSRLRRRLTRLSISPRRIGMTATWKSLFRPTAVTDRHAATCVGDTGHV